MKPVVLGDDFIEVDASAIAGGLGLAPADIQDLMRRGEITSRVEKGVGKDAGRRRLTFFHRSRRLRLVVDETGRILQRSVVDFGDEPVPPSLRRSG